MTRRQQLKADLAAVAAEAAADAGGVDPELLGDFLPGLLAAVTEGRRVSGAVVQHCRSRGQDAARRGVPLPALLDLYLSAAWRLWRHLPPVRTAARDPQAAVRAGEVMLRAMDDAVAALAAGYAAARRSLVREEESARREFVDDLLGGGADVAGLLDRAAGYGLDLTGPQAVVVVRSERPFRESAPLMGVVERAVRGDGRAVPALVASKDGALVVVAAAPDTAATGEVTDRLRRVLGAPAAGTVELRRRADVGTWRAGVGRPWPGAAGVLTSYEEAREALDLATRLELPGPFVHAADLLVYRVLLRDRAAITDLVDTVLAPLHGARGGARPLLDTLAAYYDAGGNAAHAARALHLSVRAVTYRLQRIRELTGYDPTGPGQRFALHAAVLGARLLGWPA